jgi:hypothetical protein
MNFKTSHRFVVFVRNLTGENPGWMQTNTQILELLSGFEGYGSDAGCFFEARFSSRP